MVGNALSLTGSGEGQGKPETVIVGVSGSSRAVEVVEAAADLAKALGGPFEAVHVETAGGDDGPRKTNAAKALARAQELGATVASIPAPTVADGLTEHIDPIGAKYLVLGCRSRPRSLFPRPRLLVDQLVARGVGMQLVLVPGSVSNATRSRRGESWHGTPADYAIAFLVVAVTGIVAALLRETTSVISTSIIFLFPIIAVAARSGLGPTAFAVLVAVVGHNLLFLDPPFAIDALAVQSWIMAAVLLVGGVYTSILTSSLRARVKLSDRSARESARIANFAQRLTRLSDWASTGAAVCEEIGTMLDVEAVIFREIEGELTQVADYPRPVMLEPIDRIAMQWTWEHPNRAKTGSADAQPGNWHFYPLTTSIGTLAVIGLSRADGRPPVSADQMVLLSTLLAQASLAHERLRLEDQMRQS